MQTLPDCRGLILAGIVSEAFEIVKRSKSALLVVMRKVFTSYDSHVIDEPKSQRDSVRDIEDFGFP